LPTEVVSAVKVRMLDTLGCAYGALDSDVGRAVRRMAADCGGTAQSTLIGTGALVSGVGNTEAVAPDARRPQIEARSGPSMNETGTTARRFPPVAR